MAYGRFECDWWASHARFIFIMLQLIESEGERERGKGKKVKRRRWRKNLVNHQKMHFCSLKRAHLFKCILSAHITDRFFLTSLSKIATRDNFSFSLIDTSTRASDTLGVVYLTIHERYIKKSEWNLIGFIKWSKISRILQKKNMLKK